MATTTKDAATVAQRVTTRLSKQLTEMAEGNRPGVWLDAERNRTEDEAITILKGAVKGAGLSLRTYPVKTGGTKATGPMPLRPDWSGLFAYVVDPKVDLDAIEVPKTKRNGKPKAAKTPKAPKPKATPKAKPVKAKDIVEGGRYKKGRRVMTAKGSAYESKSGFTVVDVMDSDLKTLTVKVEDLKAL